MSDALDQLHSARQTVLAEIDAFIKDREISERAFGEMAVRDHKFVGRLRGGENVTMGLLERAASFIRSARAEADAA